jgi:pimeloyl-ACP methyl ester carboxylesterase
MQLIYLHGLAGAAGLSPALDALARAGDIEVVAPVLPGFDGESGFEAPSDLLGWLPLVWDALDATGALPCPIVGASVGGMLAAELAALRPEAVTRLALLAPLGLWDDAHPPDVDPFGVPPRDRLSTLFAGGVPDAFPAAFADRGPVEQPVAQHLAWVAAASLVWPLPDHGIARRLHRITCPTLVLWGDKDRVASPALADRWPGELHRIPDAGHLLEWDAPEAVTTSLLAFVSGA